MAMLEITDSKMERRSTQGEQHTQHLKSWQPVTMLRAHVSAAQRARYAVIQVQPLRRQSRSRLGG